MVNSCIILRETLSEIDFLFTYDKEEIMDNQYDNGFNPAEPQRPFTEKPDNNFEPNPDNYSEPSRETASQQDFQSDNSGEATPFAPQEQSNAQSFTREYVNPRRYNNNPPAGYAPETVNNQGYAPETVNNQGFAPEPPNVRGFVPEQPLMNMNRNPQGGFEPQTYNPIQHTATYSNAPQGSYGNPGFPPENGARPQQSGYQQNFQPGFQQEIQNYQGYQPQSNQFNPQSSPYGSQQPAFNPQQPNYAQKKSNGGLIALIIVLASLLVASVAGLIIYIAVNSPKSETNFSKQPDIGFTLPNGFNYNDENQQAATEPEFDQSDYSSKVDPDYQGLTLNKKPDDAKESGAEYAYGKISDSVVGIMCFTSEDKNPEEYASQGSGIVITEDGYIVTNSHVIGDSKTKYLISVYTSDGKEHTAGVVGYDARTDIAVLKIDGAEGLKPAEFCDSDDVELGEDIMVVGNPGGIEYRNSMTKGIVSALDRESSTRSIVKYIQTDAAINPGNSGGPTVNMYGQVIGIASAKIVSEKFEGMGFAIPSKTTKQIVDSLLKLGYVEGRVRIGIAGTALSYSEAQYNGVPQGILVDTVDPDGPCGGTELAKDVANFSQIYEILEEHKPGDKIKIKFYRVSDKSEKEIEITLQEDK